MRLVIAGLFAAAVLLGGRGSVRSGSTPAAAQAVALVELDLVDTSRRTPSVGGFPGAPQRALPTSIYLPAGEEPAPLILLAHGLNGHPRKFSVLAHRWAQAGFAVAVPRFPVSNDEFPERDPEFTDVRIADFEEQAADIAFVVERARAASAAGAPGAGMVGGRLDPDRLGLFGLSLGALSVWAAVPRTGPAALVQSDGGFPGDVGELAGVRFPVLVAHSDADPLFPIPSLLEQFEALPAPKYLLVLHGADHAAVGENSITPADDHYHVATTVFWHRHLRGDRSAAFPSTLCDDGVTTFLEGPVAGRLAGIGPAAGPSAGDLGEAPVGTRHQVR